MTAPRRPRDAGPAPAPAPAAGPPRPRRRRLPRAISGDRSFVAGLLVLVVALAAMAAGPLERYTAAADRVDALVAHRDTLAQDVEALEQRAGELHEPDEIELLARAELGLVMPGDEAYVIVGPSPSPEPDAAADAGAADDVAWYRRLGGALSELLR